MSAKIFWPCATEPLPFGKLAPSGAISIFQALISPSVGVCPMLSGRWSVGDLVVSLAASWDWAVAVSPDRNPTSDTMTVRLRTGAIGIRHLSAGVDLPRCDGVVVIVKFVAACGEQRLARRLHVSGFVRHAARNNRWRAVPTPGQAKSRQRLRQDRNIEVGRLPRPAAVNCDIDLPDFTDARPGEAGDLN